MRIRTQHKCGWLYANTPEAGRVMQLETYATDGTTGQILQFDRRMAGELLAIIAKVFLEADGDTAER
ncbi:hypothetical protein AU191_06695 [Mycolicibacterium acapulense]|nr:hypothetical protein AU191_06695 [Mycolicibacterium acapulense]